MALAAAAGGASLAAPVGCGSSGGPDQGQGDDGGPSNEAGANSDATSFGDGGSCSSSADCNGGVCISGSGQCCDKVEHVCGGACCTGGTLCLFDKCVAPGAACRVRTDCAAGEYCETALGDKAADAGALEAGCTEPPPANGRCLPLPPVCANDAGASDAGCVSACEYHPPSGGALNATVKWSWGPAAAAFPASTDVWSTPTVGRIHDNNCDGKVDELDSPSVVFVSGDNVVADAGTGTCCQCTGTTPTGCHKGVLRMLDGRSGKEVWSLDKATPTSSGFAGLSTAIGDIDGDGAIDIVAATGEGYVVLVDRDGKVTRTSDKPIPGGDNPSFGWGGGIAIADMDHDGHPEIAFGPTVFTTKGGALTLAWTGTKGGAGAISTFLSTFADVDGAPDGNLELVAGNTAYKSDGSVLWNTATVPDGFPGIGDFDKNGKPDVALVSGGKLWILDGATGAVTLGPATLPGTGSGGPPTVADFDGDGRPEIGIAMATFYSVMKPNYAGHTIDVLWSTPNHDLSSSVTGSTVFDFEGDGKAEVIYGDECFLWVFDGKTGAVRFATSHSSFTGTEASMLADVDGDGHAEMLIVSNGADPATWKCLDATGKPTVVNGHTWQRGPAAGSGYRGIVVLGDTSSSWVGTRTLWSEHTYHVTNICDDRDTACAAPNTYGAIPKSESTNWTVPWLNDFRQNVQDKGIFDAPDAVVSLAMDCTPLVAHVSVRNIGQSALPAGVDVGVFTVQNDAQVGTTTTTMPLLPGQTEALTVTLGGSQPTTSEYYAKILVDPQNPKFHECHSDNDRSETVTPRCIR